MQVEILSFQESRIALLEHHGAAENMAATIARFIAWRKSSGLSPVHSSRTFGIAYKDPASTPPDQFRFGIAGEVSDDIPANPQGVINQHIPAGRCARLRHYGPHSRLAESILPLYQDWLPGSGEQLRDFPLFFHYLKLASDCPEQDLITDIYLPLR